MDASDWNARYDTTELVWTGEPNRFLPPEVEALAPGRALDVACGEGRNAVWLATRGWTVTGVDFSSVGLAKAARLADERGVSGQWIEADVTTWTSPTPFDLVLVFYLQLPAAARRAAVGAAVAALDVDGTFLLVAHDLANLAEGYGGPSDPEVLTTAEGVVDDLVAAELTLGVELVVERAGRIERPVVTAEGDRTAIDTLVRARRVA
ncbi:MAG: class I SAM-dependent methyltransferase [Acidimicrobiia bacterium]|nr:class I SAM-dependent methyltransferase [Acidimicrobiia bacterium]